MGPMDLELTELVAKIQGGEISPLESVQSCIDRIEKLNGTLNAFTIVCKDDALALAKEQTELIQSGKKTAKEIGILCGVPFGVKDLEDCKGLVTSYGAVPFKDRVATEDSVQVQRLRDAGGIIVGKTNVPIFGSTILTKNLVYGVTRNPWDPNLTPGGSSGGSSSAIAAKMVPFATAADGGGSIRAPACFTGCFGIKPTRGLIPMTEGRSLGMERFVHCVCFGPITRSVADAALLLDITAGYHPDDPFSLPKPSYSFMDRITKEKVRPLKILFTSDFGFISHVEESILRRSMDAIQALAQYGHEITIEEFGEAKKSVLPDPGLNWALVMGAQERAMVLPNVSEEDAKKLDRGILQSWAALEAMPVTQLGDIFRDSRLLNDAIENIFKEYDIIASPAMPIPPFEAKGPVPAMQFHNPLHVVGFLSIFNFSGHPASVLRLPNQRNPEDLAAIQLVGPRHQDDLVMQLSAQYEQHFKSSVQFWPKL